MTPATGDPSIFFGGKSPVNSPSPATKTPTLGAASAVAGGGNINAGNYWVGVTALDAAGRETLLSGPSPVNSASSGSHIILPVSAADAGTVQFRGYIGLISTRLLRAAESTTSPVSITDYPTNSGYGAPDLAFNHYRFQGKRCWSTGAQTIAIVNVVTTIPGGAPSGTACVASFTNTGGQAITWTANQWAGRWLSHVGQVTPQAAPIRTVTIGIVDALILGNTTDGKLYLARDISYAHYFPNSAFVGPIPGTGDYFTIRHLPTSITGAGFADATIPVPTSGGVDLTAYIVAGTGTGSVVPLASIAAGGVVTIAGDWPYGPPDSTSIILIAEKTWSYDSDAQPAVVDGSEVSVTYSRPTTPAVSVPFWPIVGGLQVPNVAQAILFRVLTCNAVGAFLDDGDVQYRDVYVVAKMGSATELALFSGPMTIASGVATPNTRLYSLHTLSTAALSSATVIGAPPTVVNGIFQHCITTDATLTYAPTFDASIYADAAFLNQYVAGLPNCFICVQFRLRGDGKYESTNIFNRPAY